MTRQSRWRALSDFNELRIFMAGRLLVSRVLIVGWRLLRTGASPREQGRASQGADTNSRCTVVRAMALDLVLLIGGLALAWLTLRDVFDTVVVPGGSRASLQVTRRVGTVLLALYKLVRGRKRGISSTFAPL